MFGGNSTNMCFATLPAAGI